MKVIRGLKILFAIMLLGIITISSLGCNAQRKPADDGARAPAPTAPAPAAPLPENPAEANRLAGSLAEKAVRVEGVKEATVVLTGSTALVGIDLQAGINRENTSAVKAKVAEIVKGADNRIKNVLVSTDPDTVTRISRVSRGIAEGRPITSFSKEVGEIIRRISPATR